MKSIQAMKSSQLLRRMAVGILIFFTAYGITSIAFMPSVRFHVYRFVKHKFLPAKTRPLSPAPGRVKAGEHIILPQLQSLSEMALPAPGEKLTLITSFSLQCPFSVQSVPFWMRLKNSLPEDKVNYIFLGCTQSIAELKDFVQATDLRGAVFFGACDQVESAFKAPKGGITHCLLDKNSVCLSVWTGMPVKPEYEVIVIDEIIQEISKHSQ